MRVFIGGLFQETNDFAPVPTGLASFDEMAWRPRLQPTPPEQVNLLGYGGALQRATELGLEIIAGPYSAAIPAARAAAPVWQTLKDELLDELRQAMPVELVYLFLHGAMMVEGVDDCEGDLLTEVRKLVGDRAAVGAVFDLHGNLTQKMMQHADFIVACKEYPHTDFPEESARVIDLLVDRARNLTNPVSVAMSLPLLAIAPTTFGPVKQFVSELRDVERLPGVLSASAFHGFFGADHPDAGGSVVVTTDGNLELARSLADSLGRKLSKAVRELGNLGVDLDAALNQALSHPGPVVLADRSDNTGGGAGGDSTVLLAELLRRGVKNATLGMMWDPVAAEFCALAGEGARLKLRLGGKVGPLSGSPLDVNARVVAVRRDVCQAFFGRGEPTLALGLSAVIDVDGVEVVIASVRQQVFSRHVFEGHGIDLSTKKLIVVKSTQHFYGAFAPLGKVIYCDLPGTCQIDVTGACYTRIKRPIWPLDEIVAEQSVMFQS